MAERTSEAAEIGQRAAEQAMGTAQRGARRIGDQVRDAAESLLQEQKDRAADVVRGLADALRQTAHTLERDEQVAVAQYADQAAAQIDRLSDNLRTHDFRDLVVNIESFARRQPSLFIAGAVATGFIIGRILARPADGAPRGYAMTGGERAWHRGEERAQEPLAGYGPVTGRGDE